MTQPPEGSAPAATDEPTTHLTLDSPQGRLVLLASILGSAMPFVDGTAVNIALPSMATEMATSFSGFQWILNAYLITQSALVLEKLVSKYLFSQADKED